MNINNLFFNILYCNSGQFDAYLTYLKRISKTMKQHKLVFITQGKVIIGEKKYHIKRETLIYYSPASFKNIEINVEEPITFLSVLFEYVNVTSCDGKYSIADGVPSLPLQPILDLTDFYPVETVFRKLALTWNAKLPGYEFISKTLLQELFITVAQNRNNQSSDYAASLKVEKVIQYMREHINGKSNLAELAQ